MRAEISQKSQRLEQVGGWSSGIRISPEPQFFRYSSSFVWGIRVVWRLELVRVCTRSRTRSGLARVLLRGRYERCSHCWQEAYKK